MKSDFFSFKSWLINKFVMFYSFLNEKAPILTKIGAKNAFFIQISLKSLFYSFEIFSSFGIDPNYIYEFAEPGWEQYL